MNMNDDDLELLGMEMAKLAHIKPKPKINPGPTKAKLVEGNLGFNEGHNSAEYEVMQQTGKSTDEIMQNMQPRLYI